MSEATAESLAQEPKKPAFDINAITKSPAFLPGIFVLVGLIVAFWSLFRRLPDLWFEGDGYYSHGVLVPLISGYIVYKWWPRLEKIPVKPGWFAIVPIVALMMAVRASYATDIMLLMSAGFLAVVLCGIWFAAGIRWALALSLPVLYLGFMLPIWSGAIDTYTNPLQNASSAVALQMLKTTGFEPTVFEDNKNVIYLNNFTLDVGVPCSGFKLVLAVTAFTLFFMLIAKLKFWGNFLMMTMILPLCLFVNGLRIALIGVVGDYWGQQAGHDFHDYSGYITLLVCFFILFKFARILGWKD